AASWARPCPDPGSLPGGGRGGAAKGIGRRSSVPFCSCVGGWSPCEPPAPLPRFGGEGRRVGRASETRTGQKSPAPTSPPARVASARQASSRIDWLTKRTEPSANSTFTPPPVWQLRALDRALVWLPVPPAPVGR